LDLERFDERVVPPTMDEILSNFVAWKGQIFLARAAIKAMVKFDGFCTFKL